MQRGGVGSAVSAHCSGRAPSSQVACSIYARMAVRERGPTGRARTEPPTCVDVSHFAANGLVVPRHVVAACVCHAISNVEAWRLAGLSAARARASTPCRFPLLPGRRAGTQQRLLLVWVDVADGHGWKWVPEVDEPSAASALEALCLAQFGLLDVEVADLTDGLPPVKLLKRIASLDFRICNGATPYLLDLVAPSLVQPAPAVSPNRVAAVNLAARHADGDAGLQIAPLPRFGVQDTWGGAGTLAEARALWVRKHGVPAAILTGRARD